MASLNLHDLKSLGSFNDYYGKSLTYKQVLFQEHARKSNLFTILTKLDTQLTQLAIQDCTVIGL